MVRRSLSPSATVMNTPPANLGRRGDALGGVPFDPILVCGRVNDGSAQM